MTQRIVRFELRAFVCREGLSVSVWRHRHGRPTHYPSLIRRVYETVGRAPD